MFVFSLFFVYCSIPNTPIPLSFPFSPIRHPLSESLHCSFIIRRVSFFSSDFEEKILDYFSCCHLLSFPFQNVIWYFFFVFSIMWPQFNRKCSSYLCSFSNFNGPRWERKRDKAFKIEMKVVGHCKWFMIKILQNLSFICFRNALRLAFVYKSSIFEPNDIRNEMHSSSYSFFSIPSSLLSFLFKIFSSFATSPCVPGMVFALTRLHSFLHTH